MAHSKSALKYIKTSKKKQVLNKAVKSSLFTLEKKIRTAVEANDGTAQAILGEFCSKLDKAAKRNVVHANKIARKKSILTKLVNAAK